MSETKTPGAGGPAQAATPPKAAGAATSASKDPSEPKKSTATRRELKEGKSFEANALHEVIIADV